MRIQHRHYSTWGCLEVLSEEARRKGQVFLCAGFIRAAADAIRGSPLKDGFLTGKGWSYDDMAEQTGGGAVCGTCRYEQHLQASSGSR